MWDLTGNVTIDTELIKSHHQLGGLLNNGIQEDQLIQNAEIDDNVHLIEKIDDISDSAINSCCFYDDDLLATGSRFVQKNHIPYLRTKKFILVINWFDCLKYTMKEDLWRNCKVLQLMGIVTLYIM